MRNFHGPAHAQEAIRLLRLVDQQHSDDHEAAAPLQRAAQVHATLALTAATLAASDQIDENEAAWWAAGLDPAQRGIQ